MAIAKRTTDVIEGYKSDVLCANLQSVAHQDEGALAQVREQAERVTPDTQDAIAKNPLTAVSIALVDGVGLCMISRGR